nr:hypothetical protein [Actinotalea subterranea]
MCSDFDSYHPITRRENTSMTNAARAHPENVRQYVMSATHNWSGPVAVKSRSTRSGRVSGPAPGTVVREALGAGDAAQPGRAHQPVDRATCDPVALPVQLGVDLVNPVDAVVLRMHLLDQGGRRGVADRPGRRWAGLGGVVGARGDLQADRLDPETVLVLVEADDHFNRRSSSAAAKYVDAVRRIGGFKRSVQRAL